MPPGFCDTYDPATQSFIPGSWRKEDPTTQSFIPGSSRKENNHNCFIHPQPLQHRNNPSVVAKKIREELESIFH